MDLEALEEEEPPTRGSKRDRLATFAAFRASRCAWAARHLARAPRFTKANAPAARERVDRRREALLAIHSRHCLRGRIIGGRCCGRRRGRGDGDRGTHSVATEKHARRGSGSEANLAVVTNCRNGLGVHERHRFQPIIVRQPNLHTNVVYNTCTRSIVPHRSGEYLGSSELKGERGTPPWKHSKHKADH